MQSEILPMHRNFRLFFFRSSSVSVFDFSVRDAFTELSILDMLKSFDVRKKSLET